ncbi:MAG TPA: carbonic anhydrase [Flavobacteriales bacterium]|nr:carbonic anhydrase [Flavobacteriales bacterium]HIB77936.1 carbonic anhydrase [Flavobacteriales bacterium]HIO58600.1 carbonic anhydrase [Flavobacteriales bacterium]
MITQTKDSRSYLTPEDVLEILKSGNRRFIEKDFVSRDFAKQIEETARGQFPYAVILSCIDSRVPTEIIFDQGIGDVFCIRVAGNVVNSDVIGSLEFSCKVAGAKLVLVLGHTSCGAIKGACDDVNLGELTGLLDKIKPSINKVVEQGDRTSKNLSFVNRVAETNVDVMKNLIRKKSPILQELELSKEVLFVGGMYSVETGEVNFF